MQSNWKHWDFMACNPRGPVVESSSSRSLRLHIYLVVKDVNTAPLTKPVHIPGPLIGHIWERDITGYRLTELPLMCSTHLSQRREPRRKLDVITATFLILRGVGKLLADSRRRHVKHDGRRALIGPKRTRRERQTC